MDDIYLNTENKSIAQLLAAGNDFFSKNEIDAAIVNANKILIHDADNILALRLLAACYYCQGKYDDVLTTNLKIIALPQANASDYFNLACLNLKKNHLDVALEQCLVGLKLEPNSLIGLNNLSDIYSKKNNMVLLEKTLNIITNLYPNNITKWTLLKFSEVHRYFGRYELAISNLLNALPQFEDIPTKIAIYNDLGFCSDRLGKSQEAKSYFDKIFEIQNPADNSLDLSGVHLNLAFLFLNLKDYRAGWNEYEFRLLQSSSTFYHKPIAPQLKWDGTDLNHKILLLHYEQGFGDNILFIRYVKMIKQRYPHVKLIFICPAALLRLFSRITDIDILLSEIDDQLHFDYMMPLLSIPFYFKLYDESAFMPQPYLTADPILIEKWRSLFINNASLKIGINWACDKTSTNAIVRTCKLSDLLFIQNLPNVTVYSLQLKISNDELMLLQQSRIIDLSKQLTDFADTAAVISQLDLIISVDTATVHVAGALGKPTWLLHSYFTEWRYPQANGDKTPWYDSVSIIRQTIPRDWSTVIEELKLRLR